MLISLRFYCLSEFDWFRKYCCQHIQAYVLTIISKISFKYVTLLHLIMYEIIVNKQLDSLWSLIVEICSYLPLFVLIRISSNCCRNTAAYKCFCNMFWCIMLFVFVGYNTWFIMLLNNNDILPCWWWGLVRKRDWLVSALI